MHDSPDAQQKVGGAMMNKYGDRKVKAHDEQFKKET